MAGILIKTTFYEIGHHGSHNATPVDFVENTVGNDFWAMASTHHVEQWPSIPKEELLAAIGKRTTKIARSDKQDAAVTNYLPTSYLRWVYNAAPKVSKGLQEGY